MECRAGCGACCIAPSINTAMPDMPHGKAAGVRCLHLDENDLCRLFGQQARPGFCQEFSAQEYVCGSSKEEALQLIAWLEVQTS